MAGGTINVTLKGFQAAPSPNANEVTFTALSLALQVATGIAADQCNKMYSYAATLAASGTLALDLQTSLDPYGAALALTDVLLIAVINDDSGAGGVLELRPNASNGLTNLLGASSAVKLPKGAAFIYIVRPADRLVVSGSNKKLDIVETGGSLAATVKVLILGRT